MVKIKNVFGDEYRGKQKHAVYQKRYGKQIRRIKEDKKANRAPAQLEQQRRFKIGISWYKSLSYFEKEGLKLFLNERGIGLTPQQYAIKTALDRGKVTKIVLGEQVVGGEAPADWDAEGWNYRQEITLTNNTASDLTDYQVKLELDASKVGAHFDWARMGADLRFYDENGNELSYYIESWDETGKQAIIWVKVGLIPASSTAKIKMYYGNSEAVSESDGEAVFEFFDDFEGASLDTNKWTEGGTGTKIVSNSVLTVTSENDVASYVESTQSFDMTDKIVEVKAKLADTTTTKFESAIVLFCGDNNRVLVWNEGATAGYNAIVLLKDGTAYGQGSAWQVSPNFVVYGITATTAETIFSRDDSGTVYYLTSMNLTVQYKIRLGDYFADGSYGTGEFDWVRVRKYAEQEPSIEFRAEEEAEPGEPVTITVEHVIVEHSGMQNVMILDENGELIKEYTNLSDIASGDIATRLDFINRTEKTVRTVIIESISGVLNKWTL